jgi:hypothetical protein
VDRYRRHLANHLLDLVIADQICVIPRAQSETRQDEGFVEAVKLIAIGIGNLNAMSCKREHEYVIRLCTGHRVLPRLEERFSGNISVEQRRHPGTRAAERLAEIPRIRYRTSEIRQLAVLVRPNHDSSDFRLGAGGDQQQHCCQQARVDVSVQLHRRRVSMLDVINSP